MSLRDDVRAAFTDIGSTSLDLAWNLAKIQGERLYRQWGFRSMRAWLAEDTSGNVSVSYAFKLAAAGMVFWSHKAEAMQFPITALIDAAKLVQDGVLSREEALSHLETDTLPDASGEHSGRTTLSVPRELADLMQQAFNVARFELEQADPSESIIWESILQGYINAGPNVFSDDRFRHTMSDGRELTWDWEQICMGEIRCKKCGSWDRSSLDGHHVIPRSQPGGSDGPIVLLCHQVVQPEWRAYATEWGYAALLPDGA